MGYSSGYKGAEAVDRLKHPYQPVPQRPGTTPPSFPTTSRPQNRGYTRPFAEAKMGMEYPGDYYGYQGPSQGMTPHGMPPHAAYLAGPAPPGARSFQQASFPGVAPYGYTTQYMGEPETFGGGSRQRQYHRSASRANVDRAKAGEKILSSSDREKTKPAAQDKKHQSKARPDKEAKANKRPLDEETSSKSTKTADVEEPGRPAKQCRTRGPVLKPSKVKSVIGTKEFARLRNKMIQQQETFTHQVWELRRLMNQQAIAEHLHSCGVYDAEYMLRRTQHPDARLDGLSPQGRDSYRHPSGKAEREAQPSAGRSQRPGNKKSSMQSKQEPSKTSGKSSEQAVPKKSRVERKQHTLQRQPDEPRASPKQLHKSMDATVRASGNSSSPAVRGRDSPRDSPRDFQWKHPMAKPRSGEVPPGPDGGKPPVSSGAHPAHAYDNPYRYMMPPSAMMPPPMMASMGPPRPYGPMPPPMDPYAMQQYMTAMHQHSMYPGPPRGY